MNLFNFIYFPVFTVRAGPQVGPGRFAGRDSARGGRPQIRPSPEPGRAVARGSRPHGRPRPGARPVKQASTHAPGQGHDRRGDHARPMARALARGESTQARERGRALFDARCYGRLHYGGAATEGSPERRIRRRQEAAGDGL